MQGVFGDHFLKELKIPSKNEEAILWPLYIDYSLEV